METPLPASARAVEQAGKNPGFSERDPIRVAQTDRQGLRVGPPSDGVVNLVAKSIDVLDPPVLAKLAELLVEPAVRRQRKDIVCALHRIAHLDRMHAMELFYDLHPALLLGLNDAGAFQLSSFLKGSQARRALEKMRQGDGKF